MVRKNSTIQNLSNLKGKKSCHTGFGRNVGYKIPITKLKKHGILKLSTNPQLSSLEKELKALSEFFSGSCLVGTYSPNDEVNRLLSKKLLIFLLYIFHFGNFSIFLINLRKTLRKFVPIV